MHNERCMRLAAERDGSGFAGGQKGFAEREHVFLPSAFLGLVSVTIAVAGGWLVSSNIFHNSHHTQVAFSIYGQVFCIFF